MSRKPTRAGDAALGMNAQLTRRDFLGSALLASGSLLLAGATPVELFAGSDDFTGMAALANTALQTAIPGKFCRQVTRSATASMILCQRISPIPARSTIAS